jgi:hypothetical protein
VTIKEIRRILTMYERRIQTAEGRLTLRHYEMARNFLTKRVTPSDIHVMNTMLERDIAALGVIIENTPKRVESFVGDEKALAGMLADPVLRDESGDRVSHDVDCVAAVLTLRRGKRPMMVEDARAIFATSSSMVLARVRQWYNKTEGRGIEPAVHIRALSNLAWLKRPELRPDYKERELIALCTAALRPSRKTWVLFLRHLDRLKQENRITSDEVASILVAELSDRLLRDAEAAGPDEPDAATMDEIVDRVRAHYSAEADEKVERAREDARMARTQLTAAENAASEAKRAAAEREAHMQEAMSRRAADIAKRVALTVYIFLLLIAGAGSAALIVFHHESVGSTVLGSLLFVFVLAYVLLDVAHLIQFAGDFRLHLEGSIKEVVLKFLRGG